MLFLLYGDILTIRDTAERVREAGKRVFVHLDLIDGLAAREISADFVARSTSADGGDLHQGGPDPPGAGNWAWWPSSGSSCWTPWRWKNVGAALLTRVRRSGGGAARPDAQDYPPPVRHHRQAIIAGGLITDKEDVTGALGAGAVAVSSTNPAVWRM